MRQKIIAGNWKMYKTNPEAVELVNQLNKKLVESRPEKCKVVICPPFTALAAVSESLQNSLVELGAQNLHFEKEGAYTGEISADMLKSAGARWVLIGHSERRQYFGEDESSVNRKIRTALDNGLEVIFCVGEKLEEREQELTKDIILNQVEWGLKDMSPQDLDHIVIAYEPVWAIGTGKTATPEQAQEVHSFIREMLDTIFEKGQGAKMTILYGGSVKPENAAGLFSQPDLDGALVGGACLKADSFFDIIQAGEKAFA
ncbi:MAG: triose-phosphate isomerase [Calditrichia bacterium]